MQQADACREISEMNHVAALLRRHGYTFSDRGAWLVVNDPVHSLLGGRAVPTGTQQIVIRSLKQARKFIAERS